MYLFCISFERPLIAPFARVHIAYHVTPILLFQIRQIMLSRFTQCIVVFAKHERFYIRVLEPFNMENIIADSVTFPSSFFPPFFIALFHKSVPHSTDLFAEFYHTSNFFGLNCALCIFKRLPFRFVVCECAFFTAGFDPGICSELSMSMRGVC